MEDKNELKNTGEEKLLKKEKTYLDEEVIIAYAQLVFHTLKHSGSEITPRAIRAEVKMFYEKFGNKEVKRLANIIVKEKKEKK